MTQASTKWTKRPEGSGQKKGGKYVRRFYAGLDSPGWGLKAKVQAAIDAKETDLIRAIASLLNACAATKPVPAAEPAPPAPVQSISDEDLERLVAKAVKDDGAAGQ